MTKMVKVIELESRADHCLWVRFSDGSEGVRDYSDMIAEAGPMVLPLRDQAFFDKAFISFGVPTWPNGYAVDAIGLHLELSARGLLSSAVVAVE